MANMTANEQLMLELVNRARMDPLGEAKRMGIDLNEGIARGSISSAPKQILAGNDKLAATADAHSSWMLSTDTFSHTGVKGSTPTDRMKAGGYAFTGTWSNAENIALVGEKGTLDLTDAIIEQHKNLFLSVKGHRQNIMGESSREIGVGQVLGDYKGFNTSMVTQNFASTGTSVFVTGVVYNDTVTNDNFFTVGEQTVRMGVIGTGGIKDTTGMGGGYELGFSTTGRKSITFDGDVSVSLTLSKTNLKVDFVNGKEIWTNASVTSQSETIKALYALGISKMNLTGSAASEKIHGNVAANSLTGNGGHDTLCGNGGNDTLYGGKGIDSMTGGTGNDTFRFKVAADSGVDRARDVITDFGDSGTDKLDFSGFAPQLVYKDEAAIDGPNQINVTASGKDVIVHVNLDEDMDDEMQVLLKGTTLSSMTASDFIL
jgi:Ca2+-binding RTX toxin-like protein